jgi:hypothetical protein
VWLIVVGLLIRRAKAEMPSQCIIYGNGSRRADLGRAVSCRGSRDRDWNISSAAAGSFHVRPSADFGRSAASSRVFEMVGLPVRILAVVFVLTFTTHAAEVWPADVQSFIDDRTACDHFRGEPWSVGDEPEIKGRREFIFDSIKKYCAGTDERLAGLRIKYERNPRIIERLREYEDRIESQ